MKLQRKNQIRGMSEMSDGGEGTEGEQESLPHDQNLPQNRNEYARKLWQKAARSK